MSTDEVSRTRLHAHFDDAALVASGGLDPDAASAPRAPSPLIVPVRNGFVRLAAKVHPLARPEADVGRVSPSRRIENLSFFFRPSAAQRADRDALGRGQLDPTSVDYHRWLSPEGYAARFGARAEDIASALAWLRAEGFEVHRTSRLGTRVTFSGTVDALESAFQTELHHYVVGHETHYAMATPPALPSALAGVVLGLYNTHDFYAKPASRRRPLARWKPQVSSLEVSPDGGPDGGPLEALGPSDWATAYDVAKLYSPGIGGKKLDGAGVTVGIVGTAAIAQSDIDAFRTRFNLPASTVAMTLVPDTGPAAAGRHGDGLEAILDVEWSGAIAKGATVQYVFVGGADTNVDDATFFLVEENLAPVMSESYGGCEEGIMASDADIYEENGTAANLLGITYLASAGDNGAADCGGGATGSGLYVNIPGSLPGVTGVGGTQFPSLPWTPTGTLEAYPAIEQVWNESDSFETPFHELAAGGGGISAVFARPDYQSGVETCMPLGSLPIPMGQSSPASGPMRQVPDVALSAAAGTPGYYVECTFGPDEDCAAEGGSPSGTVVGGTSASSPSFAGVVAILNQAVGERLGNINSLLYSLSAASVAAAPFHDITSGNNEVVCGQAGAGDAGDAAWPDAGCSVSGFYGYAATTGYDCASGLGSIDAYNLVLALARVSKTSTALAVDPAETTEGAPVTLTATVTTIGTNPASLTGNVTFSFESYKSTGATDLSWELGAVSLSAASPTMGVATVRASIPPGLVKPGAQWVDVIAEYGGDTGHLPSTSRKVGVGFGPLSFAVDPAVLALAPGGNQTLTTKGGTPPVRFFVKADTTHGRTDGGDLVAASVGEDQGDLSVGPRPGYVEVAAIDHFGAEALAFVTVGAPTASAPWSPDAGPFLDADVPPHVEPDASALDGSRPDSGDAAARKDSGRSVETGLADEAGEVTGVEGSGLSCAMSARPPGVPSPQPVPTVGLVIPVAAARLTRRKRRPA